jgi:hypothetical protein
MVIDFQHYYIPDYPQDFTVSIRIRAKGMKELKN